MALSATPSISSPKADLQVNPYVGCGVIGVGMTGLILKLDENRVVKIAKVYPLDNYTGQDRSDMEYINEINRKALKWEIKIYERLGKYQGITPCLQASDFGVELAFAHQGNLERYIETAREPHESLKIEWILSITKTLSYVHSCRVFVDEVALRNLLVHNGRLLLADFGQSLLLPLDTNMDTICQDDLTAKIEILHLGWIIYSIIVWRVNKYYFFDPENSHWSDPNELPPTDHIFYGSIIKKCWNGEYISVSAVVAEAYAALGHPSS